MKFLKKIICWPWAMIGKFQNPYDDYLFGILSVLVFVILLIICLNFMSTFVSYIVSLIVAFVFLVVYPDVADKWMEE